MYLCMYLVYERIYSLPVALLSPSAISFLGVEPRMLSRVLSNSSFENNEYFSYKTEMHILVSYILKHTSHCTSDLRILIWFRSFLSTTETVAVAVAVTVGGPGSIPAEGGTVVCVCGGEDWVRSAAGISSETK